jgi:hypothetical protein
MPHTDICRSSNVDGAGPAGHPSEVSACMQASLKAPWFLRFLYTRPISLDPVFTPQNLSFGIFPFV